MHISLSRIIITSAVLILITACGTSGSLKTQSTDTSTTPKKRDAVKIVPQDKGRSIRFYTNGMIMMQSGNYKDALKQFYQALLYDDSSPEIYENIAQCLIRTGDIETAEINLNKALALDSNRVELHMMMGGINIQRKRLARAVTHYLTANKLDPSNVRAFKMIAFIYSQTNSKVQLKQFLNTRAPLIDADVPTAFEIAKYYFELKEYESAGLYLDLVLRRQPDFAEAQLLGAHIKLEQGKTEDAIRQFKGIIKQFPENRRVQKQILSVLRAEERWTDMEAFASAMDGADTEMKLALAEAYYKQDKWREAQKIFAEQPLKQQSLYFVFIAADTELKLKNYETAHAYFSMMIQRNPRMMQGYYGAGFSLMQQQRYEEAEKVLLDGIRKSRNPNEMMGLLSQVLTELKKMSAAEDLVNDMLKQTPNDVFVLDRAANFFQTTNDFSRSDSLYERALTIDPDNASILNNYAYSLSKRAIKLDKALTMVKKALVKEPNSPYYLDTIGWIYFKMKKYELAREFIEKSIAVRPNDPGAAEVYDHLGDVYQALGRTKEARNQWKKAFDLDPKLPGLKQKLQSAD